MSIFDTEKDHFDNIDETVAGSTIKDIMSFMDYIPSDIFYNSFTKQNWKDIEKYTGLSKRISNPWTYVDQCTTYYVELNTTFHHVPETYGCIPSMADFIYNRTYSQHSNIRCARLELVRKKNTYYICPNFVKWPIVIENCGLDELPKTIKFAKKNLKSKSPLTFIVRSGGEKTKWIKDLPKGSIVYILPSSYFTIQKWQPNNISFDFFKYGAFNNFLNAYGQKIIVGSK